MQIVTYLMGQPDLISTAECVGLARGFSVVAFRAGTALVGNTNPFLLVVVPSVVIEMFSSDGPSGPDGEVTSETELGVVSSGTEAGDSSVFFRFGEGVNRWCLKLGGNRAELKSSNTSESKRPFLTVVVGSSVSGLKSGGRSEEMSTEIGGP